MEVISFDIGKTVIIIDFSSSSCNVSQIHLARKVILFVLLQVLIIDFMYSQ